MVRDLVRIRAPLHYVRVIYDYGQGIAQDDKTAVKRYTRAAEQGHADAKEQLKSMGKAL